MEVTLTRDEIKEIIVSAIYCKYGRYLEVNSEEEIEWNDYGIDCANDFKFKKRAK